ncbi:MAG TPA: hypothetical protein PKM01_09110, partial [Anaerolineaceae bacterium]|nr:hypothetical protein [Anaerolineaceae bacterium]
MLAGRTKERATYWRFLLLLMLLAAALVLGLILVDAELRLRGLSGLLEVPLHSPFQADYSADPRGQPIAAMNDSLLRDLFEPGFLPTLTAFVPTITPAGPLAATPTPAAPIFTPLPTSTAAPGMPSSTPLPTATPLPTWTATLPGQPTRTAT